MTIRSLCIHAHFYQPPREDPLTGIIPNESGAHPYLNWNERIHAECYRPNAELGNFEQISFNLGPTLGAWMQGYDPLVYGQIITQDQRNMRSHGVGNAIAQAYNHTILPLAPSRDKRTQMAWGIADFEHRFGHKPQGMWLPETAVDNETLEMLASLGIEFTILAPWQAEATDLDVSEPYTVALSGNRQVTVFFYQQELSAKISFDSGATLNADTFVQNILQPQYLRKKTERSAPQLILVASDGELYGHHQFLRERFLARLVDGACSQIGIQSTYPALWLKSHPPRSKIAIRESTSWSCHHGVRRWTGGCNCTPGEGAWKRRLRQAFDRLGEQIDGLYEEAARPLVGDPWELRDRYIYVILRKLTAEQLIEGMAGRALTYDQLRRLQLLLEAQRERQRMFTSCGWFFEDFDRIEPKNNVAYAAQAVRLTLLAVGVDLEPGVKADLKGVVSNRSRLSAARVFENHLRRAEAQHSERVGFAD